MSDATMSIYYGLKSSGLWCNYKLCFLSSWCLPHKSRAPQNEILSKCQFNSWQLPSDYFRLALRSNRPFFIKKNSSALRYRRSLYLQSSSTWIFLSRCEFTSELLLSLISLDAGLCFCILNWTFSANLDRVCIAYYSAVLEYFLIFNLDVFPLSLHSLANIFCSFI